MTNKSIYGVHVNIKLVVSHCYDVEKAKIEFGIKSCFPALAAAGLNSLVILDTYQQISRIIGQKKLNALPRLYLLTCTI